MEANLEFSVMAPETFHEMKETQRQEQYKVFLGQRHVFGKKDDDNETDKENSVEDLNEQPENLDDDENHDDDDDDDDDVLAALRTDENDQDNDDNPLADDYFDDDDDDEEENEEPASLMREERAFLKLWKAITQWVTPEAVRFIQTLRQHYQTTNDGNNAPFLLMSNHVQSHVDRSDLGASRCAGLMATLQMYMRSALEELGHDVELRRTVERLVGDLLRTFDYSRPSPPLPVAQARALTVVLLQTVLYQPSSHNNPAAAQNDDNDRTQVPPSCQKVGLTRDEFRYLTVSAVTNLATPPI